MSTLTFSGQDRANGTDALMVLRQVEFAARQAIDAHRAQVTPNDHPSTGDNLQAPEAGHF